MPAERIEVLKIAWEVPQYVDNDTAATQSFKDLGRIFGGKGFERITDPAERARILKIAADIPDNAGKDIVDAFEAFEEFLYGGCFAGIEDASERTGLLDSFERIADGIKTYAKKENIGYVFSALAKLLGGESFNGITDPAERLRVLDKFVEIVKAIHTDAGDLTWHQVQGFGVLLGRPGFNGIKDATQRALILEICLGISRYAGTARWEGFSGLWKFLDGVEFGRIGDPEQRAGILEILRQMAVWSGSDVAKDLVKFTEALDAVFGDEKFASILQDLSAAVKATADEQAKTVAGMAAFNAIVNRAAQLKGREGKEIKRTPQNPDAGSGDLWMEKPAVSHQLAAARSEARLNSYSSTAQPSAPNEIRRAELRINLEDYDWFKTVTDEAQRNMIQELVDETRYKILYDRSEERGCRREVWRIFEGAPFRAPGLR